MKFLDTNQIKVEPPRKPKKITGTRFAAIMGLNKWSTPFSAWCEITRTYEKPFEDTIYTIAGKTIEPKICDYLKSRYYMDIKSPTDIYGKDYFKKTWGDFFHSEMIFGGMWDFLGDDFVVEVKTTKRAEDWIDYYGNVDPPVNYKLQAALYAYLLGFDNVTMTCSFLEPDDYEHPELFEPTIDNTIVFDFKVSEEFPHFNEDYIVPAKEFWTEHVVTGISPVYDEKKDAEILKALRTNVIDVVNEDNEDIVELIKEADKLKAAIDKAESKIEDKKNRLKEIDEIVKTSMMKRMRDTDDTVKIEGSCYTWTLSKRERTTVDSKKLKADNPEIYDQYIKSSVVYALLKTQLE